MNIYDFERKYAEIEKDVKAIYFAEFESIDQDLLNSMKNRKIENAIVEHIETMSDQEIVTFSKYVKNFKIENLQNSIYAIDVGFGKESINLELQLCKYLTDYNQLITKKNARRSFKSIEDVEEVR